MNSWRDDELEDWEEVYALDERIEKLRKSEREITEAAYVIKGFVMGVAFASLIWYLALN